jgi:predicted transposase/invertase (TIGR01784 family)
MKRDSIFFKICEQNPNLLFELVDEQPPGAGNYRFYSTTLKETEFRIDGVFLPPDNATTKIAYFAEFQFQKDERLYFRFFTELMMFMEKNNKSDNPYDDWRGLLIYGSRSLEPSKTTIHHALLNSKQTHHIYLNELGNLREQPLGLALMMLTIVPKREAVESAKFLMEKARTESASKLSEEAIIDLVATIIIYKFSTLEREEIEQMLGISLEESRVYQDAKVEGRVEGRVEEGRSLVIRLLNRKVGKLSKPLLTKVEALSLEQLEELSEALLDFSTVANLEEWLKARPIVQPQPVKA